MKKIFLVFCIIICACFCFSSCNESPKHKPTAYEQAVSLGYSGSLEEFLAALAGEAVTNADGSRNESAYDIAVEKGYTGSLEQWLESLGIDTGMIFSENTEE
ncbi:MAG: hypothetical protein J1E34_05325 [Oscillospiraceae bacterium]|nr:hypothetical protein [Oscillospiraceae bacterium]